MQRKLNIHLIMETKVGVARRLVGIKNKNKTKEERKQMA
jgi:hypothetical protein